MIPHPRIKHHSPPLAIGHPFSSVNARDGTSIADGTVVGVDVVVFVGMIVMILSCPFP